MKVIADLCVVPLGVGTSLSKYISECQRTLEKFDVKTNLHAYGTNLEGEWEEVFAAIKACHEALHTMNVPRVSTTLKFGTRIDKEQTLEDKIRSVADNS
ncbi:MAG: MTH1187 family thiamine-binding protein [Candidatus Omnitrophica bacterium]|nr:MTH1187 family thiamine-binding protein [Candidatus Omnitrophota bacterium]MCA9445901.1 MTH1187 family thiamine-binding protein [Candidatus Omnitrophota bacterium]